MARARIPYDELQIAAENLFPEPCYIRVTLEGTRRRYSSWEEKPTPTVIYDRRTGNYQRIGYRCALSMQRFTGFNQQLQPQYQMVRGWFLIELNE